MEVVVWSHVFEGDLTVKIDDLAVEQYLYKKLCEKELKELYERQATLQKFGTDFDPDADEDLKWVEDKIEQLKTMMGGDSNG